MSRHPISASDIRQKEGRTSRDVWLLVRHISGVRTANSMEIGLCSVIVTQLIAETFRTTLLECKRPHPDETDSKSAEGLSIEDIVLGMKWEVEKIGYKYELKEHPDVFKLSALQAKWQSFSGQLVGTTTMTDEDIQVKAKEIFDDSPDRWLSPDGPWITQCFAQSVLEAIDPNLGVYKAFKSISDRWRSLSDTSPIAMSFSETAMRKISSDKFGFSVQDGQIDRQVAQSTTETVPRASASRQRIVRELQLFDWSTIDGITAYAEDLTQIQAFISGPVDSPYEGGIFELEILIPDNYPLQEPKYRFLTAIYHPWINEDGEICMQGAWCPAMTIQKLLICIQSILYNPVVDEYSLSWNPEVSKFWSENERLAISLAKEWTRLFAMEQESDKKVLQP